MTEPNKYVATRNLGGQIATHLGYEYVRRGAVVDASSVPTALLERFKRNGYLRRYVPETPASAPVPETPPPDPKEVAFDAMKNLSHAQLDALAEKHSVTLPETRESGEAMRCVDKARFLADAGVVPE